MGIYIMGNLGLPPKRRCKTVTIFDDGTICDGALVLGKAVEVSPHGEQLDRDALPECDPNDPLLKTNLMLCESRLTGRYERSRNMKSTNLVSVRWHDGYLEEFQAVEVRFGSDLLWLRLVDGANRHIPLRSVRWFGMSQESHQTAKQADPEDMEE